MRTASFDALIALGACSSTTPSPTPTANPEAPRPQRMVDIGYGEMPAHLTPESVTSLTLAEIRLRNLRDISEFFETLPGATVERTKGRPSVRVPSVTANQSASHP